MKTEQSAIKKEIREKLARRTMGDSVSFKRDGTVVVKRNYFYRHGMTAGIFAAGVADALGLNKSQIVAQDCWAPWPRDSYFSATFKIEDFAMSVK